MGQNETLTNIHFCANVAGRLAGMSLASNAQNGGIHEPRWYFQTIIRFLDGSDGNLHHR
jgi:hypothetical protein